MASKPNLFIPGFPKSGTSSLHSMLCQHPEIYGGKHKEPHTYSFNNRYKNRFSIFKEQYSNLASKFILDSSTTYMVSGYAVERILEDTPDAKFIIIARDPIDRIVSHYNWLTSLNLVNLPFDQEIKKYGKEKFDYRFHYHGNFKAYIEFSKYGEQLTRLIEVAGREAILFLEYEAVFSNWSAHQEKLFSFLDIEPHEVRTLQKNKTSKDIDSERPTRTSNLSGLRLLKYKIQKHARRHIRRLNGLPTSKKIKNPINKPVTRKDVEPIVLPQLLPDIEKFVKLEYPTKFWPTINQEHV